MGKLLVLTLVSAFCLVLVKPVSRAESTTFDTYTQTYSDYRDAHDDYLKARQAYLEFGTLRSKTDAETATKTMLILRSETLLSYLRLLAEREGARNDLNGKNLDKIGEDIVWYSENLEQVKGGFNLDAILAVSAPFENRYEDVTFKYLPISVTLVNSSVLSGYQNQIKDALDRFRQALPALSGNTPKDKLEKDLADAASSFEAANLLASKSAMLIVDTESSANFLANDIKYNQSQIKEGYLTALDYLIEIGKEISL